MSIKTKTIWATVIALFLLVAVLDAAMYVLVKRTFGEMELRDARKSVERGNAVVLGAVDAVDKSLSDWAAWDDTCQFIQDKNSAYVDSNLSAQTLATLQHNVVLYYDIKGGLVFGKGVDLKTQSFAPLPDDFVALIKPGSKFLTYRSTRDGFKGIVMTRQGPLMFSARPITTSDYRPPIKGTLIFARYLTSDVVKKLSQDYGLSLAIQPAQGTVVPADYKQAQDCMGSKTDQSPAIPLSEDRIAAYSCLNDAFGKPALTLRVDLPREIHRQSLAMIRYTTIGLVVMGLVFGCLNVAWLYFTVLKRITSLDRYVKDAMADLGLG